MNNNKRFNPYVSVDAEGELVISGIAGQFLFSDNIKELQDNLSSKMDLGSKDHQRWTNCNNNNIFFSISRKSLHNIIQGVSEIFALTK